MPSRCANTGTRASFWTRSTRLLPPRGTITSRLPERPFSISPTAARSVVGTSWIACCRQAGRLQPFDQAGMDRRRRIQRIRAAAQDHRIAGLEAERAGVGRHVGPALVDDADDAERRAHALDMQAVRPIPFGNHLADRIGEVGDGSERRRPCRGCACGVSFRRSMKAALSLPSSPFRRSIALASRIRSSLAPDGVGHGDQRGVLALGAGDGERPGGGARPARRSPASARRILAVPCHACVSMSPRSFRACRGLRHRAWLITRSSRCTIAERAA